MESGVEESDVDSDSNDDDDQQTDVHEVELTAMQHRKNFMTIRKEIQKKHK